MSAKMHSLQNVVEKVVEEKLNELMPMLDCCKCEDCKSDIMALVLNNLKPRYVSTTKGQLFSKLDSVRLQYETDVLTTILKAVAVVSKNPRHDEDTQK